MANVTLIRPPVLVAKWAHTTPTCPPIGLAYVASSLVAAGHTVRVVDAVGEAPASRHPTGDPRFLSHGLSTAQIVARIPADSEVIGISIMFSHEWPLMRDICAAIRARFPAVPLVAGGEHITALPAFTLENCAAIDVCVLGEGEETMVELVAALTAGTPAQTAVAGTPALAAVAGTPALAEVAGLCRRGEGPTARRERLKALDDIPPPAWDLFPLEQYLDNGYGFGVNRGRSMPVLATRGCPYQCTFCSNPTMWGPRWLARDARKVFVEMMEYKAKYRIDNFDFYDLTAIVKKDWIVRFTDLVRESRQRFTWQLPSGTRSEAIDADVSRRLYESGCRNMSYAPESGSPAVLTRIKKKIKLSAMLTSMGDSVRAGINCKANIILGFPGETHGEVRQTLWFCVRMALAGVHDMSISPFSPYPGSELFEDMRAAGRIPDLTDAYFFSLAAYTDITTTTSCSEHISDKALGRYRLWGMLLFYAVLYLGRPWRLVRTIRNVFSDQQESRLEMSLRDLVVRLRTPSTRTR
ncbi:MAG: B12-binding domain-containing radical SAM protein [Magnetospirillum sp.]|nr:B12-binding domain-containing radical SAM protein [Magnetospirillum sp.]